MTAITLRQLEVFAQVVQHGSFRRCADHIGVTQVAVSAHIRALEAGLGQPLFQRSAGGRAVLTEQGTRAYERTQVILQATDDLLWNVDRSLPQRRVTVAVHNFMLRYVQPALAELRQAHADLDLVLETDPLPVEAVRARIRSRAIDIGYFFGLEDGDRTFSVPVRDEALAIFVGRDHPLARARGVTAADLADVPAVMLPTTHIFRGLIDRALATFGWVGGRVALETEEFGLILSSVHRSLGFVCMFRAAEEDLGVNGALVRVDLATDIPPLQIRQTVRRTMRADPLVDAIVARLAPVWAADAAGSPTPVSDGS
jgi:DNA-binding transcriptional LysR family regulator